MKTLRQIYESFRFAAKALKSNVLRTILSLLGVTAGTFAIISVLNVVDLEKNISECLNFLGMGVIYADNWSLTKVRIGGGISGNASMHPTQALISFEEIFDLK